jgi:hypothetical protein
MSTTSLVLYEPRWNPAAAGVGAGTYSRETATAALCQVSTSSHRVSFPSVLHSIFGWLLTSIVALHCLVGCQPLHLAPNAARTALSVALHILSQSSSPMATATADLE